MEAPHVVCVSADAPDHIRTKDGHYYKVRHGAVECLPHHVNEIKGRYPVSLFPVVDPGSHQPNISWSGDEDELAEIADGDNAPGAE